MVETVLYTCEYCKKQYSSRVDCEKCEKSHSHNSSLHKKLTNILKNTSVFYCYKGEIGTLYIYKVNHLCDDQSLPECKLHITCIEVRLNRIFDWYHIGEVDSYKASYFVENVETEFWKPLKNIFKLYYDCIKIFEHKIKIEEQAEKDENFVKYNVLRSNYKLDIIQEFRDLFKHREDLDRSIKVGKQRLKEANKNKCK